MSLEENFKKQCRSSKKLILWHIPKPDTRVYFNENGIIEAAKKGAIFCLISVDLQTPENLKEHFSEMTHIFKNT